MDRCFIYNECCHNILASRPLSSYPVGVDALHQETGYFLPAVVRGFPLLVLVPAQLTHLGRPSFFTHSSLVLGKCSGYFPPFLQVDKQINESPMLNYHSTQHHWPHTLERGCSVGPCILIHCWTKFPSSYSKLTLKITYYIIPPATFIIY